MSPVAAILPELGAFSPLFEIAAVLSLLLLANVLRRHRKGVDVGLVEWLAPAGCLVVAGLAASFWRLEAIPGLMAAGDCNPQNNPFTLANHLKWAERAVAYGTSFGAALIAPVLFFLASTGSELRDEAPRRVWWLRGVAVLGAAALLGWLWLALPIIVFGEAVPSDLSERYLELWSGVPPARLRIILYASLTLLVGLAMARASRFEAPRRRMLTLTIAGLVGVGLVALSTESALLLPVVEAYGSSTMDNVHQMVARAVFPDTLQPWWMLSTLSTAVLIALMGAAASFAESGPWRLPRTSRAVGGVVAIGLILGGLYWQRDIRAEYFGDVEEMVQGPFDALTDHRALPRSSSALSHEDFIIIEATRGGIQVIDNTCKVGLDGPYAVEFENGKLPAADAGAGPLDALVGPLEQAKETRKRQAELLNQAFDPTLVLVIERTTPLRQLACIVETTKRLGFHKFKLAVAPVEEGYPELEPDRRKIGALNVTAAGTRSMHADTTIIDVRPTGFELRVDGAWIPYRKGCPANGPTVCLKDTEATPGEDFRTARNKTLTDSAASAHGALEDGIGAYDFVGLYRLLERIKDKAPEETTIYVTGTEDIPLEMLVRVMDTARYKRDLPEDAGNADLWEAPIRDAERYQHEELFPDALLGTWTVEEPRPAAK